MLVKRPSRLLSIAFAAFMLQVWLAQAADMASEPASQVQAAEIQLQEVDDADCAVNDGKLITLTNIRPESAKVVWVDRWYMDKQTADHTRHILDSAHPSASLGCSISRAGNQHWTIYSVADLPL